MYNSLQPHGLQQGRLPCPPLSPRVCSDSCPLSPWCHPTVSSYVAPFSSCPQSRIWVFSNGLALCVRRLKYWSQHETVYETSISTHLGLPQRPSKVHFSILHVLCSNYTPSKSANRCYIFPVETIFKRKKVPTVLSTEDSIWSIPHGDGSVFLRFSFSSGYARETEWIRYACVCVHKEIYGRNWLIKLWGAPKSCDLLSASLRTRKKPLIDFHPKTEGWRDRAAYGLSLSPRSKSWEPSSCCWQTPGSKGMRIKSFKVCGQKHWRSQFKEEEEFHPSGPQWTEWCPSGFLRVNCFTQPTESNAILFEKCPPRRPSNNVLPANRTPLNPVKLAYKSNQHNR